MSQDQQRALVSADELRDRNTIAAALLDAEANGVQKVVLTLPGMSKVGRAIWEHRILSLRREAQALRAAEQPAAPTKETPNA